LACETGIKVSHIKLYHYDKEGFDLLTQVGLENVQEVTFIAFSRTGTRIAALYNEPVSTLKVYDYVEEDEVRELKEILSLELDIEYGGVKFNPINSNYIYLHSLGKGTMVNLIDSFPDSYQTTFIDEYDFNELKKTEEKLLTKRSIQYDITDKDIGGNILDYCFDMYGNIYLACSKGYIYLYETKDAFKRIVITYKDIQKDCITLSSQPVAITLSQKYLVCAMENGHIAFEKIYISEKDLKQYEIICKNPENYEHFSNERNVPMNIEDELVTFVKYDPFYQKLIIGTQENSIHVIHIKGEVFVKDKEREDRIEISDTQYDHFKFFEESKSHTAKVIGVRELGKSSQIVSVGVDRKIIFWELSDCCAKFVHHIDFEPVSFEVDTQGSLMFMGSREGVLRVFDISNRAAIKERLLSQYKYCHLPIDKIILHSNGKYGIFFSKNDDMIYMISTDTNKNNFDLLGYIQVAFPILDVTLYEETNEIIVLVSKMLLSYKVIGKYNNTKTVAEVKAAKDDDIFKNFVLECEIKARKVDPDLNILIKSNESNNIWTVGTDKYFRLYEVPRELYEVVKEDKKKKVDDPLSEIKAHNLDVTCGLMHNQFLITGSLDGTVQIRKDRNIVKHFRTHSFMHDGIFSIHYSPARHLLYVTGNAEGDIIILTEDERFEFPMEPIHPAATNLEQLINSETAELIGDDLVRDFKAILIDMHNEKVYSYKKNAQSTIKSRLVEIKNELNKFIHENEVLPEIEQLSKEEMVIDTERVRLEEIEDDKLAQSHIKNYFIELCELEMLKVKLYNKTFNSMLTHDEQGKVINNNIRLISSTNGDKVLKSYPIRTLPESYIKNLNYVKQLRLMEINEKYKRKGQKEVIDETKFSYFGEDYLVNRFPGKIKLIEYEIKPSDVLDYQEGDVIKETDTKRTYKMAKYKLQKDPYENENMKHNKLDELDERVNYRPDEQLLKEDLNIKFKTYIVCNFLIFRKKSTRLSLKRISKASIPAGFCTHHLSYIQIFESEIKFSCSRI
jgi:WD40 repeat protein